MNHDPVIGALQIIRERKPNFQPKAAFILGSGLGVLADELQDKVVIPYEELEGFPVSTVQGHSGELVLWGGVDVVCMKGRARSDFCGALRLARIGSVCDHQHGRRLGRCRIVSRPHIEVREASRSRFHSLYEASLLKPFHSKKQKGHQVT